VGFPSIFEYLKIRSWEIDFVHIKILCYLRFAVKVQSTAKINIDLKKKIKTLAVSQFLCFSISQLHQLMSRHHGNSAI